MELFERMHLYVCPAEWLILDSYKRRCQPTPTSSRDVCAVERKQLEGG